MGNIKHSIWTGRTYSQNIASVQARRVARTLRAKLEAEWNRPGVRCANNLVGWSECNPYGPKAIAKAWISDLTGLWFRKGAARGFRSFVGKGLRKPKKQGRLI